MAAQPTGRRDQITDAAAILFNEHGYDQTSMDDIAAAVGIRKPTLYHHVSSKAQILGWIHEAAIAMVYEPLQGYLAQGMAPDEVILAVAKDTFGMFAHNLGYLRIFSENHRNLDPEVRSVVVAKRDEYFRMLVSVLDEGCRAGMFQIENTRVAAMAFFGMVNWIYQWYSPDGEISADELAEQFYRIFTDGIRVRA